MKNKMKYIVIAVLILVVCSAGAVANNYWYRTTPCNAIDISLTDARVITFLDTTNMATPTVYKCNYNGYNTWLVCWHTQTQSQRVYVDIFTGQIVGTGPKPGPCWHTVETFRGRHSKGTDTFTIKGNYFRMNWEAKTTDLENDSYISVVVYKELVFPTFVDGFTQNTFPFGTGTYYVYEGPGVYNLDIAADKLDLWTITVEDFY